MSKAEPLKRCPECGCGLSNNDGIYEEYECGSRFPLHGVRLEEERSRECMISAAARAEAEELREQCECAEVVREVLAKALEIAARDWARDARHNEDAWPETYDYYLSLARKTVGKQALAGAEEVTE